jgi:TANFOR domain-containing protein
MERRRKIISMRRVSNIIKVQIINLEIKSSPKFGNNKDSIKNLLWMILLLSSLISKNSTTYCQSYAISVNVTVSQPFTPDLDDYFKKQDKIIATLTNNSRTDKSIYVTGIVTGGNGIIISTVPGYKMPVPIVLRPGIPYRMTRQNIEQVFDEDHLRYAGISKDVITMGPGLPEGEYLICLRVYDYNTGDPLSGEDPKGCSNPINIRKLEPPDIIQPECGSALQPATPQNVVFSWSMPAGSPYGIRYVLRIKELLTGLENINDVMHSASYPVFLEKTVNMTTCMIGPADPALSKGKTYAFTVQVIDPSYKAVFNNNGISDACSFLLNNQDIVLKTPDTTAVLNKRDTIYAGENGEFTIILDSVCKTNKKFTGRGKAYINWLKAPVVVRFDTITVDSTKKLCTGKITGKIDQDAPDYPKDWAVATLGALAFSSEDAGNIMSWLLTTNGIIPYNTSQQQDSVLYLPVGVSFSNGSKLAITEMVFKSDKAEMIVVTSKNTPQNWGATQTIGFKGKGIKFHPLKIETPPDRLELLEDLSFGNTNNKIVFLFKKPQSNHSGCYIIWGEDGLSEYGIEIEAQVTRDWLFPSPDNNEKASATLSAVGTEWNDLILTGVLKKCEITGTGGMTVMADSMAYDMSDALNPSSIRFPKNYCGDTSVLFRGFYMKKLNLEMPSTWQTQDNSPPKLLIRNLIIGDQGITFTAQATSVIQFPKGKVADLSASIDTILVAMANSSLTTAEIKGKIGLPVSKADSIQNPLKYLALLSQPMSGGMQGGFQLTIEPTGPINAHLLKGKMELSETSNITAYVGKLEKSFDICLNGDFKWEKIRLGPVKNIDFSLKFQHVGLTYNSLNDNGLTFNQGTWSFASPQKLMANFPVTINNIHYSALTCSPGQSMHGKLNFDVVCNLTEDIGGATRMGVEMAIEEKNGHKFYPRYIDTKLDSISIHANLAAVKMDGNIGIKSDDPVYGDGFKGDISAKFNSIDLYINVGAFFGNTAYNSDTRYRYWKVEALAILPPPGIPFLPGLAFRGFGAAAYHHMSANYANVTVPLPSNAESISTTSGASFTPDKQKAFGFMVKGVMATTPKEQTFNSDIGLSGEFTSSGGMSFLRFDGAFYVGAGFAKRNDAFMKGTVAAQYDFTTKIFSLGAQVGINREPISTPSPVNLEFLINGKENLWHFTAGSPLKPNTVNVLGISTFSYAMFGNDIQPPANFMQKTIDGFSQATSGISLGTLDGSQVVNDNTKKGKGFAFGIGINSSNSGSLNLIERLSVQWGYNFGGELNLSLMEYSPGCITGLNGWYAKGNMALYGSANVKAHVSAKGINGGCTSSACAVYCCKNYPNGKDFNLFNAGFGAWASGGFPKPTYLSGGVSFNYNVLDIASGIFYATINVGNACSGSPIDTPSNFIQEDAAQEQQQQLITQLSPSGYYIEQSTCLKGIYGFTPNQAFDVAEQQNDGTVTNRTFQAKYQAKLEKKTDNGYQEVAIYPRGANALGEYEYITVSSGSLPQQTSGALSQPHQKPNSNSNQPSGQVSNANGQISGTLSKGSNPVTPASTAGAVQGSIPLTGGMVNISSSSSDAGYGNLPAPPPPVLNNLEENTTYRFTVKATLYEFKNGTWQIAKNKNGVNIIQEKTAKFSTGGMEIANEETIQGPRNH